MNNNITIQIIIMYYDLCALVELTRDEIFLEQYTYIK